MVINVTYDLFLNSLWGHHKKKIIWVGNPKYNEIKYNCAGYRIFPPSKNKLTNTASNYHIDSYNDDYNSFITLWIPLYGFSEKCTMQVIPTSHLMDYNKNNLVFSAT